MLILELFDVFIRAIWLLFKTLFSVFPVYQQLNSFKTQMIAAAIGVPVFLFVLLKTIIKTIKIWFKHIS